MTWPLPCKSLVKSIRCWWLVVAIFRLRSWRCGIGGSLRTGTCLWIRKSAAAVVYECVEELLMRKGYTSVLRLFVRSWGPAGVYAYPWGNWHLFTPLLSALLLSVQEVKIPTSMALLRLARLYSHLFQWANKVRDPVFTLQSLELDSVQKKRVCSTACIENQAVVWSLFSLLNCIDRYSGRSDLTTQVIHTWKCVRHRSAVACDGITRSRRAQEQHNSHDVSHHVSMLHCTTVVTRK